ncbi:hypothetical protein AMECASPLE_000014 [Ameca splendens]|uniref:Uncharacterized protein n=1 Tax=Ameca splendens TaxID=208324 RepID=A0ABV0Y8I3_9TELE
MFPLMCFESNVLLQIDNSKLIAAKSEKNLPGTRSPPVLSYWKTSTYLEHLKSETWPRKWYHPEDAPTPEAWIPSSSVFLRLHLLFAFNSAEPHRAEKCGTGSLFIRRIKKMSRLDVSNNSRSYFYPTAALLHYGCLWNGVPAR